MIFLATGLLIEVFLECMPKCDASEMKCQMNGHTWMEIPVLLGLE